MAAAGRPSTSVEGAVDRMAAEAARHMAVEVADRMAEAEGGRMGVAAAKAISHSF